jgi:SAM-dependent methyltransferase
MKPLWHPLSTLVVPGLGCYASPNLIRMMLSGGGATELLYSGDRMWPAVRSGQLVPIEPYPAGAARPGMLLIVLAERIPELLRVASVRAHGGLLLQGDADPNYLIEASGDDILARVLLPPKMIGRGMRTLRRLRLDLAEALSATPDDCGSHDPAESIRHKYDSQAPYYADSVQEEISKLLLERIRKCVPRGTRLLVVGSGSGRECHALHQAGYRVSGVDFSHAMIESAKRGAEEQGRQIEFTQADIRTHRESPRSLGGILFTYDVYSFLPRAAERIELLREMRTWLVPGGALFLSARLVRPLYERLILTLQWLRAGSLQPSAWGDSHTRYLTSDGVLHRSFVHCFTFKRLCSEVRAAGLTANALRQGHFELQAPGSARKQERNIDGTI